MTMERIVELGDWREDTLARMGKLIKEADPDIVEEWKWMGTPIWSHDGIICTGECYKKAVKEVDASAFKALVRQAVALNRSGKVKASKKVRS